MDILGGHCELPEDWSDSIAVIRGKYGQPNLDEDVSVASQKSAPDYNTTMIITTVTIHNTYSRRGQAAYNSYHDHSGVPRTAAS